MLRDRVRRIGVLLLLFALGWTAIVLFDRPDRSQSVSIDSASTTEWVPYWQHPRDNEPTVIHAECPQSDRTATDQRIMAGQRFLLRPSTCAPYQDREVVEVLVTRPDGSTLRGYAVKFESFEPHASAEGTSSTSLDTTIEQSAESPPAEPLSIDAAAGLPLMLDYRNYRSEYGPALIYAWYTDAFIQRQAGNAEPALLRQLDALRSVNAPNLEKMLMVSSYDTLEQVLAHYDEDLKQSGVTVIGYNTERSVGTPDAEMQTLGSVQGNAVARLTERAGRNGYRVLWGPIRNTADAVPDAAIEAMVEAGLAGVALQEQKFIERSPVKQRVAAVDATVERYKHIGGPAFHVSVQIMPSRCPSTGAGRWDVCTTFVSQLAGSVDSVAIWASGQSDRADLPNLVSELQ